MVTFEYWLGCTVLFFSVVSVFLLCLPSAYNAKKDKKKHVVRVQVVVLGDIGRSPRIQYHALSIAKHEGEVDIIGYQESEVHPDIRSSPHIEIHSIAPFPKFLGTESKWIFLFQAPLKVIFQVFSLLYALGYRTSAAKWMIVQNPPTIPTLFVAQVICFIRNTHLIIDWHNFGYSILSLKLGSNHPLVRFSRAYERNFSKFATAHFTVTDAMARILRRDMAMPGQVLPMHDRPFSQFKPLTEEQRLKFFSQLPETAPLINEIALGKLKVLVSSTSWTPDEDFSLLLDAVSRYSSMATSSHPHLPEILVIITGKGPQRADFEHKVQAFRAEGKLEMARFETAWLTTGDYACLLGAADLGISLHISSSGVDLPMKIVDMLGAGLPVLGWDNFQTWPELITNGVNGQGFRSTSGLLEVLVDLLGNDHQKLRTLKVGAVEEGKRRWDDEWDSVAGKLLGVC
ncbi:MAG: hypothetical protein Q9214_002609 [Letrouitia sp. 1 TL-2023]